MKIENSTPEERAIMINENQVWQLNEYLASNLTKIITHLKDLPHEKAKDAMYAYGYFVNTVKGISPGIEAETIQEKVISDYLEAKKKEQDDYWKDETVEIIEKA